MGERLRVRGNEFGSVTGRPRRCGWFDAAALKRAVQLNGVSGLCITKLDVLDGLDTCASPSATSMDGERATSCRSAPRRCAICEPIYEELPGWKESTVGVKAFDELPPAGAGVPRRLEALWACRSI